MFSGVLGLPTKQDPKEENPPASYDFNDGYQYPTLFQEADEMLTVSLLMYVMTELRLVAKQNGIKRGPERILQLPTTVEATIGCIEDNYDEIKSHTADHEMVLTALKSIKHRFQSQGSSSSWYNPFGSRLGHEPAQLIAFGDEKPDKELVYAVAVDHLRKRITVAFRGSVTPADFMTDACIELNYRDNPLKGMSGQEDTIGIHHGFDEYLLKRRKERNCKYAEVMTLLTSLFKKKDFSKFYKLYVTGHSLGGALASLFAFEAAAEGSLPRPITCVSVASPRVGNESFQKAFASLEKSGAVRHLRIAHAQDPVTMLPKTTSRQMLAFLSPVAIVALKAKEALLASRVTYRHTGVKLRLIGDEKSDGAAFQLSYAGTTTSQEELKDDDADPKSGGGLFKSLRSSVPGVSFHYGPTYLERLQTGKDKLDVLTLNEMYIELTRCA